MVENIIAIIGNISIFLLALLVACWWHLATTPQHESVPEQTDAERAEAGENAMYAELGRVK